MKTVKSILKIFLVLVSIISLGVAKKNNSTIIDIINQQKVLTQKILKEYAFKGMGNSFKNSQQKLDRYFQNYGERIQILDNLLADETSQKYLIQIKKIWLSLIPILNSSPVRKEVAKLQKQSDKILSLLTKLMKPFVSRYSSDLNKLINLTGYQSVIVERMGGLYMIKTWGVNDPSFDFKMRESLNFFDNSIYKMLNSKFTTEQNLKTIRKVMRSFKFFKIMNQSQTIFIPTLIYFKTKSIHVDIEIIKKRYIQEK